jgi:hypothetical protein
MSRIMFMSGQVRDIRVDGKLMSTQPLIGFDGKHLYFAVQFPESQKNMILYEPAGDIYPIRLLRMVDSFQGMSCFSTEQATATSFLEALYAASSKTKRTDEWNLTIAGLGLQKDVILERAKRYTPQLDVVRDLLVQMAEYSIQVSVDEIKSEFNMSIEDILKTSKEIVAA